MRLTPHTFERLQSHEVGPIEHSGWNGAQFPPLFEFEIGIDVGMLEL